MACQVSHLFVKKKKVRDVSWQITFQLIPWATSIPVEFTVIKDLLSREMPSVPFPLTLNLSNYTVRDVEWTLAWFTGCCNRGLRSHTLHSTRSPQGSDVSTKLTKQVDVTGRVAFGRITLPSPPSLSFSTSKIRSLPILKPIRSILGCTHATCSLSQNGRRLRSRGQRM